MNLNDSQFTEVTNFNPETIYNFDRYFDGGKINLIHGNIADELKQFKNTE